MGATYVRRAPFSRAHRVLTRTALIAVATLLTQGSTIASGDATPSHFSQRQITSYLQTVTSELQMSKYWQSSFGTNTPSSLYCSSTLLGEGVRAGLHGLYTWFTCSAIHKLDPNSVSRDSLTCTGFSSAVWIQPGLNSITYQAFSGMTEFATLRANAPIPIQDALDASFNQVNQKVSRVIVGRAVSGTPSTGKTLVQSSSCQ